MLIPLLFAALATAPCHCVSFRLDDIQDYYDREGQMAVIELFHDENEALTIGVIGNALGQDRELVNFLAQHRAGVEFANHGWRHEDFSVLSADDQAKLMNQTDSKVMDMFGVKPVTFIPPFNRLNNDTSVAASRNGLAIISADMKQDRPAIDESQIYHLPINANVSDYDEEKLYWKSFGNDVVLSDVEKGIARDGYAIIMLHPRDFVGADYKVDQLKLNQLRELVGSLQQKGLRIVAVSELANVRPAPEFPAGILVAGTASMAFMLYYRLYNKRAGKQ